MRRVESIKLFGPKISFKTLIKKILCILNAALFLATYGCAPKKAEASTMPVSDQKNVTQMVSNESGSIDNAETDTTTTPEVTPVDASFITPEVTETPIINSYFLFSPTAEEEKKLEIAAKEYFERLSENYCERIDFGNKSDADKLDIVKNFCGCFDNIDFGSCKTNEELQAAKDQIFENMENLLNDFILIASSRSKEIVEGKGKGVNYKNPETIEIFKSIKRGNYPGVLTLDALERVSENVYNSLKNGNENKLIEQGNELLILVEMIFKNNGGNYNGIEVTAFKDMYPTIKFLILQETIAILFSLIPPAEIYQMNKINSPLGLSISDYFNIVVSKEMMKDVKQEIFTLMMDAYFAKVKNGEIVIQENNEAEEKPNVPTYTPAP